MEISKKMCSCINLKDTTKFGHICKLNKAIYRLKQAPRVWYDKLKDTLLRWSFQNTKNDSSLFVLRENDHIILLLIYVDDIIITGRNNKSLETLETLFSLSKTLAFYTTSWELKYIEMLVKCTLNKQSTLEIYSRSLIWKKLHLALLHQW